MPKFSDGRGASDHLNNINHMYWEDITYPGESEPIKRVYFNIFGQAGTQYLYPNAAENNVTADNPHNEGQYHTTAKALGWDSHVAQVFYLDKEIDKGYTSAQDPSNQVSNYNEFIKKMKEYYYKNPRIQMVDDVFANVTCDDGTVKMLKIDGINARMYRAYPSLIRDFHFYLL